MMAAPPATNSATAAGVKRLFTGHLHRGRWYLGLRRGPALVLRPWSSERNIAVFLERVLHPLGLQVSERGNQLAAGLSGVDDFIEEAAARGDIGVCELLTKLADFLGARGNGIRRGVQLAFVEDVHGAFRAHDGDLRGRPRVVEIRSNVFA